MQVGNLLKRGAGRRAVGATIGAAGLVFIGLGTAGVGTFKSTLATVVVADPGCTPSTAGPGTVTVCLKEAHEGFTASSFTGHSCDNIDNRDPALDYFVFVLPAAGDPGRIFTGTPSVTFDTGATSGTINSSNAKFFFASAPPSATLLEASSSANNGTGTPTGGEAQVFNLTHTCPATATTTTTTSSTTTSSRTTTTTSKTTTTTTTTSPTTTTTTSKTTTTTTTTSPTTTTTTSKTTTTTTTTSPTTTTTTTTTSPTTTTTTSKTTTRTTTTSPTTTTRTSRTTTRTTRTSPTTTTTSGASGNLSATTTSTTSSSGAGGVLATTTPSTGADTEFGAGLALLILGGGLAFSSTRLQRRKRQ